jgi:hypothetical protein
MLWRFSELGILIGITALFSVFIELGFRLGRRSGRGHDEATKNHLGALQAGLLGLLALLLSFTFAMAVSRFDDRKALVVEEANAIGTTYLRAKLLPSPQREEIESRLRQYVQARLDFYYAVIDEARLAAAHSKTSELQSRIWALAGVLAAQDPKSVPTGLFIQSLNETIDLAEKRQVALDNRVPETVLLMLFVVSVGALGFIAFSSGLAGHRRAVSTGIFALLIALVLTIIIDLDRERRGLIRVSQESMLRVQEALKNDLARAP